MLLNVLRSLAAQLAPLCVAGSSAPFAAEARTGARATLDESLASVSLSRLLAEGDALDPKEEERCGGAVSLATWAAGAGVWAAHSGSVTVSQERVDAFAATTLDPQWIHGRDAGLSGSPYGLPLASHRAGGLGAG